MIRCSSCGRENDDSFKFCLDCGTELKLQPTAPTAAPQATAAKEPNKPSTSGSGAAQAIPKSPSVAVPKATAAPASTVTESSSACPKCGTTLSPSDAFCSSCGQRVGQPAVKGQTMFMHVASPEMAKKPKARFVLIKPDGSEGTVFSIATEKTAIGRTQGTLMFPKDPYISPRHAEVLFKEGQLTLVDLNSVNGVYRKMTERVQIYPGTYFRIGRQLLRLEAPGEFQTIKIEAQEGDDSTFWGSPPPSVWARLVQVLDGGKIGEIHLLTLPEIMIGREEGEIRFPEDSFVSSRHCLLTNQDGNCFLMDVGSSNGTYLRIRDRVKLESNDRIQIGNQVLKVDLG